MKSNKPGTVANSLEIPAIRQPSIDIDALFESDPNDFRDACAIAAMQAYFTAYPTNFDNSTATWERCATTFFKIAEAMVRSRPV